MTPKKKNLHNFFLFPSNNQQSFSSKLLPWNILSEFFFVLRPSFVVIALKKSIKKLLKAKALVLMDGSANYSAMNYELNFSKKLMSHMSSRDSKNLRPQKTIKHPPKKRWEIEMNVTWRGDT